MKRIINCEIFVEMYIRFGIITFSDKNDSGHTPSVLDDFKIKKNSSLKLCGQIWDDSCPVWPTCMRHRLSADESLSFMPGSFTCVCQEKEMVIQWSQRCRDEVFVFAGCVQTVRRKQDCQQAFAFDRCVISLCVGVRARMYVCLCAWEKEQKKLFTLYYERVQEMMCKWTNSPGSKWNYNVLLREHNCFNFVLVCVFLPDWFYKQ